MLSPTSEIKPCCRFDVSCYNLKDFIWDNQTPLLEFYQRPQFQNLREKSRNGERLAGCHRCYREEELGILSMRQKGFPGGETQVSKNKENPETLQLAVIELGVGRICNLKCRSCDPYFSATWEQDEIKPAPLAGLDVDLDKVDANTFKDTVSLKITGGEPFFHPSFERLLHRLVEHGQAAQINIDIFSNATKPPKPVFLELLESFRSLSVSLSIDGHGPQNTYLRHPSRWPDIEKTTHFWINRAKADKKTTLSFAVTVSIFNVVSVFDLFSWIYQTNSDQGVAHPPDILVQTVQDPKHLNVVHWPKRIRKRLFELFKVKKNSFIREIKPDHRLLKRIENLEKMLQSEIEHESVVQEFWDETLALDEKRSESFSAVFPEIAEILRV